MHYLRAKFAIKICWFQNRLLALMSLVLWPVNYADNVKSVCIHRVGQIGDMICALPAIYAVRKKFPNAELTLLTSSGSRSSPSLTDLATALPWIDRFEEYYSDVLRNTKEIQDFAKKLRGHDFDIWIALPQDLTSFLTEVRNMLFAKWVGAAWATGFRVNTSRYALRDQAKITAHPNEYDRLLSLVSRFGVGTKYVDHGICLPLKTSKNIGAHIATAGLLNGRPLLAIAPGGKRPENRWPSCRFAEIARLWVSFGGAVIVVGSSSDMEAGEEIATAAVGASLNLCGVTSLAEALAAFSYCKVALTNDSGPMHLASAMRVPCIVPFSARDFDNKWYPFGLGHTIIRKQIDCSPCLTERCTNNNKCIGEITVEEVWKNLLQHLDENNSICLGI